MLTDFIRNAAEQPDCPVIGSVELEAIDETIIRLKTEQPEPATEIYDRAREIYLRARKHYRHRAVSIF